jgi:hypothetical protein
MQVDAHEPNIQALEERVEIGLPESNQQSAQIQDLHFVPSLAKSPLELLETEREKLVQGSYRNVARCSKEREIKIAATAELEKCRRVHQ